MHIWYHVEIEPWCKEEAQEVDLATKIILTSMHKETREKNKEIEYKIIDPVNWLLNQLLDWLTKYFIEYYNSNTSL